MIIRAAGACQSRHVLGGAKKANCLNIFIWARYLGWEGGAREGRKRKREVFVSQGELQRACLPPPPRASSPTQDRGRAPPRSIGLKNKTFLVNEEARLFPQHAKWRWKSQGKVRQANIIQIPQNNVHGGTMKLAANHSIRLNNSW